MKTNKLLPCPFCGGKAKVEKDKGKLNDYRCKCTSCNISTSWWYGKDNAIKAWNKRTYPPEVQELIERGTEMMALETDNPHLYECPRCGYDEQFNWKDYCEVCGQALEFPRGEK